MGLISTKKYPEDELFIQYKKLLGMPVKDLRFKEAREKKIKELNAFMTFKEFKESNIYNEHSGFFEGKR